MRNEEIHAGIDHLILTANSFEKRQLIPNKMIPCIRNLPKGLTDL
jgi:hypothetical protein